MSRRVPDPPAALRWGTYLLGCAVIAIAATIVWLPPGSWPAIVRLAAAVTLASALGYAVSLAIAPRVLQRGGRLALSLGAALASPIIIALALSPTPWGLGRRQFVIAILGIMVASALTAARRGAISVPRNWGVAPPRKRAIVVSLTYGAAMIVVVFAIGIRLEVASKPGPPFTELWVEPVALRAGHVVAHIVNHEGESIEYRLDVVDVGEVVATVSAVVGTGAEWVYPVSSSAFRGDRVEVRLYRLPDVASPYRRAAFTIPATRPSPAAYRSAAQGLVQRL